MKIFLTFLMMLPLCFAQELSPEQIKIRMMIKEIKQASESERFMKMNAFKKQLRAMNAQARQEAIISLQTSLKALIQTDKKVGSNGMIKLQESQNQLQMQHQIQNQNQRQKNGSDGMGRSQR